MLLERPDSVDLDGHAFARIAKHRGAGGNEDEAADRELMELGGVEVRADAEHPRAFHDGDVLVEVMNMRGHDRSGQLAQPHDEGGPGLVRIADNPLAASDGM